MSKISRFKTLGCPGASLSIGRERVGSRSKNERVERMSLNILIYTVKCGNRLRVGVRSTTASVSGVACRPF